MPISKRDIEGTLFFSDGGSIWTEHIADAYKLSIHKGKIYSAYIHGPVVALGSEDYDELDSFMRMIDDNVGCRNFNSREDAEDYVRERKQREEDYA